MKPISVYKICPETAWDEARRTGLYKGSADDLRDGFIHLSAAAQLAGTARKHFAGQTGLVLVEVEAAKLGTALKWEISRGGALFPHLYADLPVETAVSICHLPLDEEGVPVIPAGLA